MEQEFCSCDIKPYQIFQCDVLFPKTIHSDCGKEIKDVVSREEDWKLTEIKLNVR